MENSLLLASLQLQNQREEEEDEAKQRKAIKEESVEVAESWIAASAAPWPECKGFRGMLFVQKC